MNRLAARTTLSPSLRALFGCAAILLLATAPAAAAPNQVTYSNGVNPPIVVNDGDAADLDGDADEITVDFHLDAANGFWTADGFIHATTTHPNGATLVVTDTEIVNVTGDQIAGASIVVNHIFDPIVSFTQLYTAHIDGAFDRIGGGILGNLIINYSASLNGAVGIGNFNFPDGLALAPIPFDYTGLPQHLDTVTQQRHHFVFYMDEIDNMIRLHDSATILPQGFNVPGHAPPPLAGLAALLLAVGAVVVVRERRAAARDTRLGV